MCPGNRLGLYIKSKCPLPDGSWFFQPETTANATRERERERKRERERGRERERNRKRERELFSEQDIDHLSLGGNASADWHYYSLYCERTLRKLWNARTRPGQVPNIDPAEPN